MWNVLPALAFAAVFGASLPAATGVELPISIAVSVASGLVGIAALPASTQLRSMTLVTATVPALAAMASIPAGPRIIPVANDIDAVFVLDVVSGPRPARTGAPFEARLREVRFDDEVVQTRLGVIVRDADGAALPVAGDRVVVRGRWSAPAPARHPWAWDGARAARRAGRHGTVMACGELLFAGSRFTTWRWLDRARMQTEGAILRSVTGAESGVLLAIVTGSRADLDHDLRARFAATGAAHVLAVSGLHLGLVVLAFRALVETLVRRFRWMTRRHGARRWAALFTLPMVLAYVAFAGAPASACRAGVMTGALLVADLAERRAAGRQALALAVLTLVVADPSQVTDVGFQLSVTATFGLVEMRHSSTRSMADRLFASLRASTVASVTTAPVLAWHFGSVPVASPITNLVVVPPIALVSLPLAGLGAILAPIQAGASDACFVLAGFAVRCSIALQTMGEDVLTTAWHMGQPTVPCLVALCVGALCVVRARYSLTWGVVSMAMMGLCVWPSPDERDQRFIVESIPVGHGDAFDLRGPNGARWLIDGGTGTAARRFVMPWMAAHGRARVDALLVTHADRDHAEGAADLIVRLRPRQVWIPDPATGDSINRVRAAAAEVGARVHSLGGGVCVSIGGASGILAAGATDDNDGGIVAQVCHGAICALFTGDIEAGRESDLVRTGLSRATWLKVSHHGSSTSSSPDFLDAVRPQVGLVPADRGTRVGADPHVLRRLSQRGVATWVTGDRPPPRLVTDGIRWWACPISTPLRRCIQ